MPSNKPIGRFVPTLTEVVRPGAAPATQVMDPERLVEQVLQAVKPRLEQQLRASLQAMVEEQLRISAARVQQDIEDAVRGAVAEATVRMNLPKS
jgi:hypothetical protein